ncbi:MAG: hypothetical protein RR888_09835 [Akkermansia sp.]
MKISSFLIASLLLTSPALITSCSSIAKLAGVNTASIPGVDLLKGDQNKLVAQHSEATILLLESQLHAANACGLNELSAQIESQIKQLKSDPNDASKLTSIQSSLSGRSEIINKKLSEIQDKSALKANELVLSHKKLSDGLKAEGALAMSNVDLGMRLVKVMKSGSVDPVSKGLLATQFRPIIYFVTTLPKDYKMMRQAQTVQKEAGKKLNITLPTVKSQKSKLPTISFDI